MFNKLLYIIHLISITPRKYVIILINLLSVSLTFLGYPLLVTALEIFISNNTLYSNYDLINKSFTLLNIEPNFNSIVIFSMTLILIGQIFVLGAYLINIKSELILRRNYINNLVSGLS